MLSIQILIKVFSFILSSSKLYDKSIWFKSAVEIISEGVSVKL